MLANLPLWISRETLEERWKVHLFGPTVIPTSRDTAFAKLRALADSATIVHHGLRRDQRHSKFAFD